MALEAGIPDEDNEDATLGGLSAYNDANVRKAMAAKSAIATERKKFYDDLALKTREQREGPSFSERMYQLSSAFFAPTTTRGFSGVMGNIMPVLAAQQKAQREGELKREDALRALTAAQLGQRETAATQDVATELALAKLAKQGAGSGYAYMTDRGGYGPKPGVGGNAPMPEMNQFGYYVISDPRQLVYLPPNTPVVYPGGDQTKPKYTSANPTR